MARSRIAQLLALLAATCPAWGATIDWHPTWQAALKAAKKKGHIAYIFVYLPARAACAQMDKFSFHDPEVIKLMKDLEAGAVDAATVDGGRFVELYKLAVIRDAQRGIKLAVVPAHLFFAPDGTELHRQYGYIVPRAFAALIQRVQQLYALRKSVARNPGDAKTHAELGHLYLKLNRIEEGRKHLEKAIALDPDNRAGAAARARLDIAIITIKSDPKLAIDRLRRWLDQYGRSPLRVEALFYLATAYVAADRLAEAKTVLLPFRNAKKGTPEADSDWGALARRLLKEIETADVQGGG